ncbi:MAG: hypothetical protein HEP71_34275 [Roseivirga sp.]|nr:hypothetical protein [Roseivirga sp.]
MAEDKREMVKSGSVWIYADQKKRILSMTKKANTDQEEDDYKPVQMAEVFREVMDAGLEAKGYPLEEEIKA